MPYLSDYWADQVTNRGMVDLVSASYPLNSPITARPDWRPKAGKAGSVLEDLTKHALDPYGTKFGICNPLYGVQMVFSEDMATAFCSALNDWLAKEWLDKDARLRGSIVIPVQSTEKAVAEIERCAKDKRFVQVLMLVCNDNPLGRRVYWPIYEACERHGLALGVHAGSNYHNAPTIRRLGLLPHRGLCRPKPGLSDPADQPDRRGGVREIPEPEGGDAGIRLYLATDLSLAAAQVLARGADGNALGGPRAAGNCAEQRAVFAAAGRCAAGPCDAEPRY